MSVNWVLKPSMTTFPLSLVVPGVTLKMALAAADSMIRVSLAAGAPPSTDSAGPPLPVTVMMSSPNPLATTSALGASSLS